MSKLDDITKLAQAVPTVKPVSREVVKSVPIVKPEPAPTKRSEPKPTVVTQKPIPKATEPVVAEPEALAMPPTKTVEPRVQVIFRPFVALNDRLKDFCMENNASIQDTLSLALEEFLNRRKS